MKALLLLLPLVLPPSAAALPPGWPPYASAVVAADGSDQFRSLQDAIAAAPSGPMQQTLRDAGVTCDLITVPDGTHGTREWDERLPGYADQVVAWLAGSFER